MHDLPQLHTRAFKCALRLTWLGCESSVVHDFSTGAFLSDAHIRRQPQNQLAEKSYSESRYLASAADSLLPGRARD